MNYYQKEVARIRQNQLNDSYQINQVIAAREYMDRYFTAVIDLQKVARSACCSKYHFIRLFKKYYGLTPHRYLTDLRIRAARKMLESGSSVSDTCSSLGFESSTSFAGLFKSYTGQSPSTYRKNKQFSRA